MKYNGEDIIEAGDEKYNIKTFSWHLIDICNQACKYCNEGFGSDLYRPKSSFFKDKKQNQSYKTVLKRLKINTLGKYEVDLIGGEPTLHNNLHEIISTLNSYENCVEISLITNLKRELNYYKEFNDEKFDKLLICPSIHMEYYNNDLLEKIKKISNFKHVKFIPIVMIHDKKIYYDKIRELTNTLVKENIEFTVSFLFNSYDYIVDYEDDFLNEMKVFAEKDINRYRFKTTTGKKYNLDKHSIYKNKLTNFYDWKCTPIRYNIDHKGSIYNDCTKKPLPLTGIAECVNCPLTNCGCDIQWNYFKQKT